MSTGSISKDLDFEKKIAVCAQRLLEPASTIFAVQKVYGEKIQERSKRSYGRLTEAHLLLSGVIGAAIIRTDGKIVEASQIGQERTALFASFVIGMPLCETAIAEGRYLQALTLLRQELETVAQLTLITQGKRKDGKVAKMSVLENSLARFYGDLSAAAHVSRHHIVRSATELDVSDLELPESTEGIRFFPDFDPVLARRIFALHLVLMVSIIEQMSIEYEERHAQEDWFCEVDKDAVNLAATLMKIEGVIEMD